MRNRYRFTKAPDPLRRSRLDNLALAPASLLPPKTVWQKIASELQQDSVLIPPPYA